MLGVSALHPPPLLSGPVGVVSHQLFQVYSFSVPSYHLKSAEMTQECEKALADHKPVSGAVRKALASLEVLSRECRSAGGPWAWGKPGMPGHQWMLTQCLPF